MTHFQISVAQKKKKLIARAKKSGVYENFGNKEYHELKSMWFGKPGYDEKVMTEFFQWMISYTGK